MPNMLSCPAVQNESASLHGAGSHRTTCMCHDCTAHTFLKPLAQHTQVCVGDALQSTQRSGGGWMQHRTAQPMGRQSMAMAR